MDTEITNEVTKTPLKEQVAQFIANKRKFIAKHRPLLAIAALLPAVAITFLLIQSRQDLRQNAQLQIPVIARLAFNPSGIQTIISTPVNISVLAYDANNNPIWNGISYEWGISSVNSIGTLGPVTGAVSTFTPSNNGHGDIYVTAKTSTQSVTYSIPVDVGTPQPTPLPTKTVNCDLNNDGKINNKDTNLIRQCSNKKSLTNACIAADLNGDGKVDSIDLSTYLRTCGSNQ